MTAEVFDDTPCALGEGPLWHPLAGQLFWFDILRFRLHARAPGGDLRHWQFDEHVSAAGWIDETRLLIASESCLMEFDSLTGESAYVAGLESDNPVTRSNDGRADPWGGFWIGTMGKSAEPRAGAIYRYHRGEVRKLFPRITISNAICFAPDGGHAYFADTRRKTVWRQRLEQAEGWPEGDPEVYLDLTAEGLNPDGAVVDAAGNLWLAEWGSARVSCYSPGGERLSSVAVPGTNSSCPAFGGPDLATLFVTTARADLSAEALEAEPRNGMVFATPTQARGQPEHRVIL